MEEKRSRTALAANAIRLVAEQQGLEESRVRSEIALALQAAKGSGNEAMRLLFALQKGSFSPEDAVVFVLDCLLAEP